jgi:hypothetical protein
MSLVVVKGAKLRCSHGGQIQISAGDPRLTVGDNGAVTSGMESGLSFAAGAPPCNNKTTSTPSVLAPCVTSPAAAGQALKLSVGRLPVLLDSATGPTVPAAQPAVPGTWSVASPGQAKLEAV